MKTKSIFLGITFFALGVMFTFGVVANNRIHHYNHQAMIRKSAVIEVGAPLKVNELKALGLI